jgi:hypothetical protein
VWVLIIGLVWCAVPAHADQYSYVSELDNNGVFYTDILAVINTGKATCQHLRLGKSVPAVLAGIGSLGYAPFERAVILAAAVNEMCPDQLGVVRAFVHGAEA